MFGVYKYKNEVKLKKARVTNKPPRSQSTKDYNNYRVSEYRCYFIDAVILRVFAFLQQMGHFNKI